MDMKGGVLRGKGRVAFIAAKFAAVI